MRSTKEKREAKRKLSSPVIFCRHLCKYIRVVVGLCSWDKIYTLVLNQFWLRFSDKYDLELTSIWWKNSKSSSLHPVNIVGHYAQHKVNTNFISQNVFKFMVTPKTTDKIHQRIFMSQDGLSQDRSMGHVDIGIIFFTSTIGWRQQIIFWEEKYLYSYFIISLYNKCTLKFLHQFTTAIILCFLFFPGTVWKTFPWRWSQLPNKSIYMYM